MNTLIHDIRYSLRQMRRNPGFAATAIFVLALGIGGTTGMAAIVRSVLLRPLAYRDSAQLVVLGASEQANGNANVSYPDFQNMQRELRQFSHIAVYTSMPSPVETADGSEIKLVPGLTANFFEMLGVSPVMGRTFREDDAHAAVVSHKFWKSSLHGRSDILGSRLKVNGELYTVVGVMPPGFRFPMQAETAWTTLDLTPELKTRQGFDAFSVLARLRPGVTLGQAQQEGELYWKRIHSGSDTEKKRFWVYPYQRLITGNAKPALLALFGACILLLLIAVVNVTNLQIARATARQPEMAMRAALGATRGRLFRQMVIESTTLAAAGAACGWLLAAELVEVARKLFASQPRFDELRIDPWTLALCLAVTVLSGIAASLGPAWFLLGRHDLAIQSGAAARGSRRQRLSGILVASEVALTCVLLIAAGLFLRTFRSLQSVPLGFSPGHVTTFLLWPQTGLAESAQVTNYERVVEALQHLPGVEAAGAVTTLPISNFQMTVTSDFGIPGVIPPNQKNGPQVLWLAATPGYFEAMNISLLAGRYLSKTDVAGGQIVGVVNRTFARRYLHDTDPIGREIVLGADSSFIQQPIRIVGVTEDTVQGNNIGGPIEPQVTVSYRQLPAGNMLAHFLIGIAGSFAVRATGTSVTADDIRSIVAREAPALSIDDLGLLQQAVEDNLKTKRIAMQIASAFGWVALALSTAGIYGVLAYLVGQRTREIGIRLALGATRGNVYRLVLRQGFFMLAGGLFVGWLAALVTGRWIQSFLFGTSSRDPGTYVLAGALILLAGSAAMFFPAYRAATVDPMVALRCE